MDRVNNFLYYLILVLLFGFFTFYLHSRYLLIILIVMLTFPAISYIGTRIAAKKLSLRLSTDKMWVNKGEETMLNFIFKNKSIFPVLNCMVTFGVENRYYPNEETNLLSLSVPALGEYKTCIPIMPVYNGLINVTVDRIEIRDLLDIFNFKEIKCSDYHFFVKPDTGAQVSSIAPSELYSEDSLISSKNANGTQIDGIRDYIMGDKLRNIHWKLSSKKQDILVKEYSDNNEEAAVLLVELYKPAIDDIIDNVYSIGQTLLDSAYPFTLAFATAGSEQLTKMYINEISTFREGLESLYLAFPSESDKTSMYALRREYAGSGIIYIHGGNEDKAVIEII